MKVLGVMSDAAPPAPVLAATRAAAALFDATPVALHVRTADGDEAARGAAADAGLAFRSCDGPLLDAVTLAAHPPDVVAVVLGSADVPDLLTLQVVAGVDKPVVVAPPGGRQPAFRRILVPLEGTEEGRDAIADVLAAARGHGIEVVVVHVHRADALPAVEDQPGHEFTAWTREFMTRWAPAEITKHPLELRVGRPGPRRQQGKRAPISSS